MIGKYTGLSLGLASALLMTVSSASAREINGLVFGAIEFGGDELVKITFSDGSTDSIKAGELIYLGGGVEIDTLADDAKYKTRLTIGWKFDRINGTNGEVDFDRFPLELIQFYQPGQWQFGAGVTYHMNPKLKGSGVVSGLDVEFDDALGFVVEGDYFFSPKAFFGIRYTMIDYEVNNVSVDGNSIGIAIGARF